jgi:sortase A
MKLKKGTKILITVFVTLLPISLLGVLLILPSYSRIALAFENLDAYRIAKNTYISILSEVAPSIDKFDTKVLAASSIEDSVDDSFVLNEKILEDAHTYLEVDSADIFGRVSEGVNSDAMMKGFWHFPTSAYPGEKGNVVIIGHRFQYVPPAKNTFFNLDKIKVGDDIKITEDQGEYTYIVTDINIVEPNDISILKSTDDYRLTLVTCTPLWTSNQRLVITAKLDKLYKKV